MEDIYDKALNCTPKDGTVAVKGGDDMPEERIRIRKLTPKECWRLMGQPDENFRKAEAVNSNTRLYKQAG